uniref:Uncharacterized protein n=1 Tax=Aegilops tauschii TaxID=37682 RepID=M8C8V5_AEGTA
MTRAHQAPRPSLTVNGKSELPGKGGLQAGHLCPGLLLAPEKLVPPQILLLLHLLLLRPPEIVVQQEHPVRRCDRREGSHQHEQSASKDCPKVTAAAGICHLPSREKKKGRED